MIASTTRGRSGARPRRRLAAALALVAASILPGAAVAAEAPADTSGRWGYAEAPGQVPPARWSELKDGYACRGHHQSPIALYTTGEHAARRAPLPSLAFHYRPTPLVVDDNGRFISIRCDSAGIASLSSQDARLERVDIHTPSEHTLDGKSFPMELELVHHVPDGPAMIVSVFVRPGRKSPAFDAILKALPKTPGATSRPSGASIDAAALLPADHSYLDYLGSLTTPPCTEGVRWCVMITPIEFSQDQIDRFGRDPRRARTNRPLMPDNGRAVRIGAVP